MTIQIVHDDVLRDLKKHASNSADCAFCDSPFGLKLMGQKWDQALPALAVWQELHRVLTPGGHLLAFGDPRTFHRLTCSIEDAGFQIRDVLLWLQGGGMPKSHPIANGHPDLANGWAGYGTGLKPGYQPILWAMKPTEGSLVRNAERYGIAGVNIHACRIPCDDKTPFPVGHKDTKYYGKESCVRRERWEDAHKNGRWPPNVILDMEAAAMLDAVTPKTKSRRAITQRKGHLVGNGITLHHWRANADKVGGYNDAGGASRFFFCPRASTREKNLGLDGRLGEKNIHPSVKPLQLCQWLATLILPPERNTPRRLIVPYAGTGSEMIGGILAGWDEVYGIENNAQYLADAMKRLKYWVAHGTSPVTNANGAPRITDPLQTPNQDRNQTMTKKKKNNDAPQKDGTGAPKKDDLPQTDAWGYQIPDGTWDIDALGNYAQEQEQLIHAAETFETPYYWRIGLALNLAKKSLTKAQYRQFVQARGFHKVKVSKARAIAGFYARPEDVVDMTVHDAYDAVVKERRKLKKTDQDDLQKEVDKDDPNQNNFPPVPATLTGKLAAVNDQLNRWADDLAFDRLGKDDTVEKVTAEIEKAITTLGLMKEKLLSHNAEQSGEPSQQNTLPPEFEIV